MNAKKIITAVTLIFVAGSLGCMVARENKTGSAPVQNAPSPPSQPQAEKNQQLIVYYFHGNMRCSTCHKLENYAREALDTYFAQELAAGKIQWKPTNVDKDDNEHFIKDYQLVTKAVVLSDVVNGQEVAWKNLDQIWQKVGDKNSYLEYIRDSITKFLKDGH